MRKWNCFCLLLFSMVFLFGCSSKETEDIQGENSVAPIQSMEALIAPRQEILFLSSVEQKEGLAQYVRVYADEAEKNSLLDLIYGLDAEAFVYAAPQPYTPPLGEAMDMEKMTLLRCYLSLQTAEKEYVFQILTQGETPFLRVYEMPVFDFAANGAAKLQEFDPPYIQCPAGTVDAAAFEALVSAMHENTADRTRCAESVQIASVERKVLDKHKSAQLRFYLDKAVENGSAEVSADVSYTVELHYADAMYRLNTQSGDCLREDGAAVLHGVLTPGELMRMKQYLN